MNQRARFVLSAVLVSCALVIGASCWNFDEAYQTCVETGNCRADGGEIDESDAGNCGLPLCLLNRFETPSKYGLHAVWGSAPNDVWLGGGYETTVRWDGRRFDAGTGGVYDQYSILDLWGTSASNIWAVGALGLILHWDGTRWATANDTSDVTTSTLWGVWTNSPEVAWIAGTDLWTWQTDGGSSRASPATGFVSVWGTPDGHAWAVGNDGSDHALIAERVGGTWAPAKSLDAGNVLSISGNADNNVWAVGLSNTVLHLTDAGWARVPGPVPSQSFWDVWVSPTGEVWATTNGPKVAWRDTAGNWSVFTPAGTGGAPLEQVFGFGNGDIWFVGGAELPSGYYDGGFAFRYRRAP